MHLCQLKLKVILNTHRCLVKAKKCPLLLLLLYFKTVHSFISDTQNNVPASAVDAIDVPAIAAVAVVIAVSGRLFQLVCIVVVVAVSFLALV